METDLFLQDDVIFQRIFLQVPSISFLGGILIKMPSMGIHGNA